MVEVALTLINQYGLIGIFLTTLLSYSIIPFPSEAALIAGTFYLNPMLVFLFALAGATLGSLTNYYLGKKGRDLVKNKYKKIKKAKWRKKAEKIFDKYGPISLVIFGNFPFLGDPLMIVAGSLNMKPYKFLFYSTIGKVIYLATIVYLGTGLEGIIF